MINKNSSSRSGDGNLRTGEVKDQEIYDDYLRLQCRVFGDGLSQRGPGPVNLEGDINTSAGVCIRRFGKD